MSEWPARAILEKDQQRQASTSTGATPTVTANVKPVPIVLSAFSVQTDEEEQQQFIKRYDLTAEKYPLLHIEGDGVRVASNQALVLSATKRKDGTTIHRPTHNGTADKWASVVAPDAQYVIVPKKLSSWTEGSAGPHDITEFRNSGIRQIPPYGPTITDIAKAYNVSANIHGVKEVGQRTHSAGTTGDQASLIEYEATDKGCSPDCSRCFSASAYGTVKSVSAYADLALEQLAQLGYDVSKAKAKLAEI
jgi:hypothetical protein